MLAPLGSTSRATSVHEKQWGFGWHGYRLDYFSMVVREQFVDEEIPTVDHRSLGDILTGIAPPDQDFLHFGTLFMCRFYRLVSLGLVIDQLSIAVVTIHRHQDATARI